MSVALHRSIYALVTHFQWKGNLVASEQPAIVMRLGSHRDILRLLGQMFHPRTFLICYQLHTDLKMPQ
jgi:hypothetical protein